MTKITSLVAFTFITTASTVAMAGGVSATGMAEVVPTGTVHFEAGQVESDTSFDLAVAFAGSIDYALTDAISIGLAPRYFINIAENSYVENTQELDVAVRAQYTHAFASKLAGFGYLAPGYSVLMLPNGADDASGLVLGAGAGVRFAISPMLFLQGELGYQHGFQGTSDNGVDATVATRLFHVGVGLGTHF